MRVITSGRRMTLPPPVKHAVERTVEKLGRLRPRIADARQRDVQTDLVVGA